MLTTPVIMMLAAGVVLAASPLQDKPPCGPLGEVTRYLAERFGERPIGIGLRSDGRLWQVLASSNGETWTLISVSAGGLACIEQTGTNLDLRPLGDGT